MATASPRTTPGSEVDRPPRVDALWVVALVSELTPLLALLHRPRLLSHRLCVGRMGRHRVAIVRAGVGPDAAHRRTLHALQRIQPRSVWSIGSCGALVDELKVGDVVTAQSVRTPAGDTRSVHPVAGLSLHVVQTVERPVFTPDHRNRVQATGATICEMECAGVVQAIAQRWPVHVVKVVSDHAGGTPDPAIDAHRAVAMARFHLRVERLMRQVVAPRLAPLLDRTLPG